MLFRVCINCIQNILSWDNFYKNCQNINEKFKLILEGKLEKNEILEVDGDGNISKSILEINENFTNYKKNENTKYEDLEECNNYVEDIDNDDDYNDEEDKNSRHQSSITSQITNYTFKIFHCDICDKIKSIDYLFSHMTKHALETQKLQQKQQFDSNLESSLYIKCSKCNEKFINIEMMKSHLNNVHMKIYDFNDNDDEEEENEKLKKDTNLYKRTKNNENQNNSIQNTRKDNNEFTKEIPNFNDKTFHCDICNETKSITNLLTHMTLHALELQQKQRQFNSNSLLSSLDNSNNESKIKCLKCNKYYKNLQTIKSHIRTVHMKLCNFHCKLCDKSFICNRLLLNHIQSKHNNLNQRNYQCPICKKSFKTDATLYSHKKVHLNLKNSENSEKFFKCHLCSSNNNNDGTGTNNERIFRYKHQLKNHLIVIHTNSKNYECEKCKKKFSTQNNLKKHQDTHKNSIDFKCHICGVQMKLKRYVNDHIKRVHRAKFNSNKK